MAIVGLDIGTSSTKAVAYSFSGKVICSYSHKYSMLSPQEGYFELRLDDIANATIEVLKRIVCDGRITEIEAICATSFGESMALLDQQGKPLCNALLYMDKRGKEERISFSKQNSDKEFFEVTGELPHPMLSIYKLKWLKDRGMLEGLSTVCFMADYVLGVLGGEHVTDQTLAARSGMLKIADNKWWNKALDFVGLSESVLPSIVSSGSTVGYLKAEIKKILGTSGKTRLIVGGHDQSVAAVGAGALKPGDIMNGIGSVDNMTAVIDWPSKRENFFENNLNIMPHPIKGLYQTYLYSFSGGNILNWFVKEFAKDLENEQNPLRTIENDLPANPTSLLVLPHFCATGTPYLDSNSLGFIHGLSFKTTRREIYKAFLEGEAMEMLLNLNLIREKGMQVHQIITVGGCTASKVWMQLRADIFGVDIVTREHKEAGTLGAAILACCNLGFYSTLDKAHNALTKNGNYVRYKPNLAKHAEYLKKFDSYKKLYQLGKELVE